MKKTEFLKVMFNYKGAGIAAIIAGLVVFGFVLWSAMSMGNAQGGGNVEKRMWPEVKGMSKENARAAINGDNANLKVVFMPPGKSCCLTCMQFLF